MFVALGSRHPRHSPAVGSRGLRNRPQKGTVRASVAAPALVWAPSITTLLILATLELPGIASGAGRSQNPSYLRHRGPYTRTTSQQAFQTANGTACAASNYSADLYVHKERKKENGQPKGGMGGRHAATTHRDFNQRLPLAHVCRVFLSCRILSCKNKNR